MNSDTFKQSSQFSTNENAYNHNAHINDQQTNLNGNPLNNTQLNNTKSDNSQLNYNHLHDKPGVTVASADYSDIYLNMPPYLSDFDEGYEDASSAFSSSSSLSSSSSSCVNSPDLDFVVGFSGNDKCFNGSGKTANDQNSALNNARNRGFNVASVNGNVAFVDKNNDINLKMCHENNIKGGVVSNGQIDRVNNTNANNTTPNSDIRNTTHTNTTNSNNNSFNCQHNTPQSGDISSKQTPQNAFHLSYATQNSPQTNETLRVEDLKKNKVDFETQKAFDELTSDVKFEEKMNSVENERDERWIERVGENESEWMDEARMNTPPTFDNKDSHDTKKDTFYSKINEDASINRSSRKQHEQLDVSLNLDFQFEDEALFAFPASPDILSCLNPPNNQPQPTLFPNPLSFLSVSPSLSSSSPSLCSPLLTSPSSLSPSSFSHFSPSPFSQPSSNFFNLPIFDPSKPSITNIDFDSNFLTCEDYDVINNSCDLNKYFEDDNLINDSFFFPSSLSPSPPSPSLFFPQSPGSSSIKLECLDQPSFNTNNAASFRDENTAVIKSDSMLHSVKSEFGQIYNGFVNYNNNQIADSFNNYIEIMPNNNNNIANNNEYTLNYKTNNQSKFHQQHQQQLQQQQQKEFQSFVREDHVYAAKLPTSPGSNYKRKRARLDNFGDDNYNFIVPQNPIKHHSSTGKQKNNYYNYRHQKPSLQSFNLNNSSNKPQFSRNGPSSILELFLTMKRTLQPSRGSTAHLEEEMKIMQQSCNLRSERILEKLLTSDRSRKRTINN